MTTAIATRAQEALTTPFLTDDQVELVRTSLCADATDAEFAFFIGMCQQRKLDPLARQAYFIKDKRGRVMNQVSIDGFRLIAQRTGEYEGQTQPQWCGRDGVWRDVWVASEPPLAARCGVYRKGFREPVYSIAHWREFHRGTPVWSEKKAHMLHVRAETLALRRAFPEELSGLYTPDEMDVEAPEVVQAMEPPPEPTPSKVVTEVVDAEAVDAQTGEVLSRELEKFYMRLAEAQSEEMLKALVPMAENLPDEDKATAREAYRQRQSELSGGPF